MDAYDDPNAEADLGVYRSQFGLPACTTANGCFKKVSQTGSTKYPRANAGWAVEISLDLDMVSAACPTCHILLVEASSNSFANLAAAVNYAATVSGVKAISNSYGGSDSAETSSYNHPGIAITASSGDSGYGAQSPASYPHVIGVGGTSLTRNSSTRGWTESAWSGAGSGCSTLNAKPSWQTSVTQCSGKAISDVSAVADPNTGVSVYDTTRYQGISRLVGLGRHLGGLADHRRRVRAVRQHRRLPGVDHLGQLGRPVRRDHRLQRHLQPEHLVPRGHRLGRPDRPGHPERHQRLLAALAAS